jgi:hypothetical protein
MDGSEDGLCTGCHVCEQWALETAASFDEDHILDLCELVLADVDVNVREEFGSVKNSLRDPKDRLLYERLRFESPEVLAAVVVMCQPEF